LAGLAPPQLQLQLQQPCDSRGPYLVKSCQLPYWEQAPQCLRQLSSYPRRLQGSVFSRALRYQALPTRQSASIRSGAAADLELQTHTTCISAPDPNFQVIIAPMQRLKQASSRGSRSRVAHRGAGQSQAEVKKKKLTSRSSRSSRAPSVAPSMARLSCAALVNAVDTLFHPRSLPTRQSADGPKSWQSYRMSTNMSRRLCEDELPLDSRAPDSAPPGLSSIDGWEVGYGIFAIGCLIGTL